MPEERNHHYWPRNHQCLCYGRAVQNDCRTQSGPERGADLQRFRQLQRRTSALPLARGQRGEVVENADSNVEILNFASEDVFIKGANAIDMEGNAGIWASGIKGGTIGMLAYPHGPGRSLNPTSWFGKTHPLCP